MATVGAVLRRREAAEEGGQPTGGDAGEPATTRGPPFQAQGGVPIDWLAQTRTAIDETVAALVRRVGEEAIRRPGTADAGSTEETVAAARGRGSTRAARRRPQEDETR